MDEVLPPRAKALEAPAATPEEVCPACRGILGDVAWRTVLEAFQNDPSHGFLDEWLARQAASLNVPEWLPELALLERVQHTVQNSAMASSGNVARFEINPSLEVVPCSWKLSPLLTTAPPKPGPTPRHEEEYVLVWRSPGDSKVRVKTATNEELLLLKIAAERVPLDEAAPGLLHAGAIHSALMNAGDQGLLLVPPSPIRRGEEHFPSCSLRYAATDTFSLQWHITHACGFNCKHCYDRSTRSPLTEEQGLALLDDLTGFCIDRFVKGHVYFTGGDPFLHPHFPRLYEAAITRGLSTAILGNPVSRQQLEPIVAIKPPVLYQVSLEGLEEHNDHVRAPGHFGQTMQFLQLLHELGIPSMVMLTLTKENMNDVLPLAEMLRDKTGLFTFNRIAQVGGGTRFSLPSKEEYAAFLNAYIEAAQRNPIMAFNDNLMNTVLEQRGNVLFDGCTGYGCGAAFNFLVVLPDGETHACRKFPSPLGNALTSGLTSLYDSEKARQYRAGTSACTACPLKPQCGGCMAIVHAQDGDVFGERDPHCFRTT